MTYTLTANPDIIVRDSDGAFIPADPANIDYQAYLAWRLDGNFPTQLPPPVGEPLPTGPVPQEPVPAPNPDLLGSSAPYRQPTFDPEP
jgi:hypothetical protein